MSGIEIAVLFFLLWWVVLFTTLPFGVRRAENPQPGIDTGAPENPRLVTKALVTTGIAGVAHPVPWTQVCLTRRA